MTMVKGEYEESICTHPLLPVCQTSHLLKIRLSARDTSRLTASFFSYLVGGKKANLVLFDGFICVLAKRFFRINVLLLILQW